MCLFIQTDDRFLNFKPSQLAASSLILSINLCSSTIIAHQFGFNEFDCRKLQSSIAINISDNTSQNVNNPLKIWGDQIKALTLISTSRDIKAPYSMLIDAINAAEFANALSADPTLFVQEQYSELVEK